MGPKNCVRGGYLPDLEGKKLLVLAGAGVHCRLVETAKKMGVYTIVTDYLNTGDSPAKAMADEQWMLNITDVDEIVTRCKEEGVEGVINVCIDPAQRPINRSVRNWDFLVLAISNNFIR